MSLPTLFYALFSHIYYNVLAPNNNEYIRQFLFGLRRIELELLINLMKIISNI